MKKHPSQNENQLGNLLLRYKKHFKPPQASVKKECLVAIKNITGLTLTEKQLAYTPNTRTLVLQVPSILKSELKISYKKILTEAETLLGKDSCPLTII